VQAIEKKIEGLRRSRRIKILDYRNNTKTSPENAEDTRGWTCARAIWTRQWKFKVNTSSRPRGATRATLISQPLVGARICDNIELRRHACREAKLGMTRFPFPVCRLSLKQRPKEENMRDDDLAPLCRPTDPGGRRLLQPFYSATVKIVLSMGLMVAAVLFAAPASAHGRLGAAEARCRLFIGPDVMNFTGYMPDADKNEFCEDIPATGRMIIALDDIQDELRDMQIEIRIVKDLGSEERENENLDAVTVAHSEPRYYRSGTINFQHNFPEAGYFVGIVTAIGDHGERWVSRFPFSVGESFMRALPAYLLLGIGVISIFFIYLYHRKLTPPAPIKTITPHDPEPTPAE
jgi:hypothetical protein